DLAGLREQRLGLRTTILLDQPLAVLEPHDADPERHAQLAERVRGRGETGLDLFGPPLQRRESGAEACPVRAQPREELARRQRLDEAQQLLGIAEVAELERR